MRLKEIETKYGDKVEVNLDALTSLRRVDEDNVWEFNFGMAFVQMYPETGRELLSEIMKPYVCKNEGDTESRPAPVPRPHQIMVDNNVLDKNQVRYSILSADFLDAEDKLELLVRLGV